MNRIDEHELQAWVDGELAPEDAARVAAAVASDPALAQRAERERRLRQELRTAFDPVLDEPVPPHLLALLQADGVRADQPAPAGDTVVPMRPRRGTAPRRRWSAPVYALAASLAVLAATLWLRPTAGPVRMEGETLLAQGELAESLDSALASAPRPDARLAIGVTFRDAQGRVCRSFVQRSQPALSGLACREDGRWTLPVLSSTGAGGDGELRQASSAVPPEVQAAIDIRMQGDTFDAEQERAAKAAGWR